MVDLSDEVIGCRLQKSVHLQVAVCLCGSWKALCVIRETMLEQGQGKCLFG